jgi:hypothetical protein
VWKPNSCEKIEAKISENSENKGSEYLKTKKIYRLKEDQAFSLSLELGRREKVVWHPSADFLLPSVGGGGDFVDTVIAVKMI